MSWVGWLFLLAGLYVLLVVVRGIVQFVSWWVEEYIVEPRAIGHRNEKSPQRPQEQIPTPAVEKRETKPQHADERKESPRVPVRSVSRVRRPTRLGGWLKSLKLAVLTKGYDYWVGCALSEEDRELKIRYLSKALKSNPAYLPAWGMKGNTLFELGRYDEALECFDQAMEIHPSALMWYKKGLCCYRAGRRQEALQCLDEALEKCPGHDRQLLEDVTRMLLKIRAPDDVSSV
jgi:tetratricopeptide (TPR) repeat protein